MVMSPPEDTPLGSSPMLGCKIPKDIFSVPQYLCPHHKKVLIEYSRVEQSPQINWNAISILIREPYSKPCFLFWPWLPGNSQKHLMPATTTSSALTYTHLLPLIFLNLHLKFLLG
jgi:hypothetical protein